MNTLILTCEDVLVFACDFSKNKSYFHVRTHEKMALQWQQKGMAYGSKEDLETRLSKPLRTYSAFNCQNTKDKYIILSYAELRLI